MSTSKTSSLVRDICLLLSPAPVNSKCFLVRKFKIFNTNNLWLDLQALRDLQAADPAAPELPLIVNRKTVDPRDKSSK